MFILEVSLIFQDLSQEKFYSSIRSIIVTCADFFIMLTPF